MNTQQMRKLSIGRLRAILYRDKQHCESKEKHFRRIKNGDEMFKQSYPWAKRELAKVSEMMKVVNKLSGLKKPSLRDQMRCKIIEKYMHEKLMLIGEFSLAIPR